MRDRDLILRFPLGLLALLGASACHVAPAQQASAATPVAISANDLGPRSPVNRMIFGLNIVETYEDQKMTAAQMQKIAELHPAFLRIPPGQHANYYDWETGKFSIQQNELNLQQNGHRDLSSESLDDLFSRAHELNVPVSYVVNMSDSVDKTEKLISYIKTKKLDVKFWELGNELNAASNKDLIPGVADYLSKSNAVKGRIKNALPGSLVGVDGGSALRQNVGWNMRISGQSDFDGVILHRYQGPTKSERQKTPVNEQMADPGNVYSRTQQHSSEDSLQNYSMVLPGKKYWISEYGLLYTRSKYENSLGHAIWLARTIVGFMRNPQIQMAAYWDANAKPFELVGGGANGRALVRAPYYAFYLASNTAKENGYHAKLSMHGGAAACIEAEAFFPTQSTGKAKAIFLVNGCDMSFALKFESEMGSFNQAKGISGDSPSATNGNSVSEALSQKDQINLKSWEIKNSTVVVPAYSVGVLSAQ